MHAKNKQKKTMIDPKLLRHSAADVAANLARRGFAFDAAAYLALEERRKALQVETEQLQSERNTSAKSIGKAKAQGEDIEPCSLRSKISVNVLRPATHPYRLCRASSVILSWACRICWRMTCPSVAARTIISRYGAGANRSNSDSRRATILSSGRTWDSWTFDAASRISGARFAVMTGPLARLQRALIQFMLDTHTSEHGYIEAYVPYLVRSQALVGTGQLPKFEEDLFKAQTTEPKHTVLPDSDGRSAGDQSCARHDLCG